MAEGTIRLVAPTAGACDNDARVGISLPGAHGRPAAAHRPYGERGGLWHAGHAAARAAAPPASGGWLVAAWRITMTPLITLLALASAFVFGLFLQAYRDT